MLDWKVIQENGFKPKDGKCFKILSLDGGGIRGIFAAQYLANVEKETGKKINEYFDMIVGTSTGGIIALALSVGIPASEILDLYLQNGDKIFSNRLVKRIPFLKPLVMMFTNLYSSKSIEQILKDKFGEKKINDSDVMLGISSLENSNGKPKVYKTPHSDKYFHDKDLELWKVALATSAAPLYFNASEEDGCKIDGGLWANNPILVGITEALKYGIDKEDIRVLSIGTGMKVYCGDNRKGLLGWRTKLVDLVMCAQSFAADNYSKYLIDEKNIVRINFCSSEELGMDNVKKKFMKKIQNYAVNEFLDSYKENQNVEGIFFK